MPIIKNVKIFYAKLNPEKPDTSFKKKTWNLQGRTSDIEQRNEWKELGLNPKLLKYADDYEDDELAGQPILDDDGKRQWRIQLSKSATRRVGEGDDAKTVTNDPVEVVTTRLEPLDPKIIGNGSIGHIRLYVREYAVDGVPKTVGVLQGVQIKKLVRYEYEGFEAEDDYEEVASEKKSKKSNPDEFDDNEEFSESSAPEAAETRKAPPKAKTPPKTTSAPPTKTPPKPTSKPSEAADVDEEEDAY